MNILTDENTATNLLLCCSVLCFTFALAAVLGWLCAVSVLRARYDERMRRDARKVQHVALGLRLAIIKSNAATRALLRRAAAHPARRAGETTAAGN